MINPNFIIFSLSAIIPIIFFIAGLLFSSDRKKGGIICAVIGTVFTLSQIYFYYYQNKSPLVVSPSSYTVTPGVQSKFILKLTNTLDYPVFNIAVRIRIEEGDMDAEDIHVLPIDKTLINSDLNGLTIHHDLFGFLYVDKNGKSVAQYNVYDIDATKTKNFAVKINTDTIEQKAKLSLSVVNFSEEPKEIVRRKSHSGFFDKGNAFAKEKQYSKAIENYEKAITHGGKSAKIYLSWGNVLFESGNYDNAIAKYKEAVEMNPKYVSAFFNLGIAYLKNDEIEDAIKSFQKVKVVDPHSELAKKSCDVMKLMGLPSREY